MTSLPHTQKYIMFLNPIYFKKNLFQSIYNKIKRKLENKGIVLFNIDNATYEIINYNERQSLTFDDSLFPNANTLYIHLFGNQYYSDYLYNKKKIEIEREMLFLLAGKLGVKTINYETEIVETSISKANINMKMKGASFSTNFNKTIKVNKGSKGMEEYINRGAAVYLKYNNIEEVEKNIEYKMDSNIFNYNFYKNSPKLQSFVYKRFEFKMQKLDYTIETEDISDLSFAIKTFFTSYGIDISFVNNINCYENVHYTLEFFTDDELKKEFGKKMRYYKDKFYTIREYYDLIEDKDKAVHFITEYVMEYANNYHYILKDVEDDKIHNFSKHIQNFIKEEEPGKFEGICHSFQSTSQIRNWINKEFLNDNMEIINEMDITDFNNQDVIKEDRPKYNIDKVSVIMPFEKKEVKEDEKINQLQYQLEYLAKDTNTNNSNNSINSLELKLDNIIKNCEVNNDSLLSLPITQRTLNDEDNYLNIAERPPVFPASSATSINSVFEPENQIIFPNFPPPPPPNPPLTFCYA
jgi:hypothetical protein